MIQNLVIFNGQGAIVFLKSVPIGFMKLHGERLFLSAVNLRNSDGKILLVRGGLYSFDHNTRIGAYKSWRIGDFKYYDAEFISARPNKYYCSGNVDRKIHKYRWRSDIEKRSDEILVEAKEKSLVKL